MTGRILKPLSLVGVLDEMFDLYKGNLLLFLGIAALIELPANLAAYAFGGEYASIIVLLVTFPITYITLAAATWAVSQIYLGSKVTILGAYKSIIKRAYPFIATMFGTGVIIGCGFMLCGIPGIIFSVWYAFVSEVFIIEGLGWGNARTRSRQLAAGEWKRILLLSALAGILSMALQVGVVALIVLIPGMDGAETAGGPSGALYGLGTGIAEALTSPIGVIAFVLLYYDIRVRKEGFDIEMLARNVKDSVDPDTARDAEPA